MEKLGIDIGRVLITPDDIENGPDTSFIGGSLADALATPPYPGMFDTVPRLVQRFGGRVWLVSKCGPGVAGEDAAVAAASPVLRAHRHPARAPALLPEAPAEGRPLR